jgi:uncharacterized protein
MSLRRLPELDVLRGFALFGILVVNAPFFLMPEGSFGTYSLQAFPGWHNRAAEFVTTWLFDGKFILIFSFLFGWGLHTQMAGRPDFAPRYFRRLLGLFVIGLLHAVFLFAGDILVTYAVLGAFLYLVRHWPVRRLLAGALFLWFLSIFTQAAVGALIVLLPQESTDYSAIVELHRNGSFFAIVAYRLQDLLALYAITPLLFAPEVMGMFMAGLAAARTYAGDGLHSALPLARKILRLLWLPALALNALYASAWHALTINEAAAFAMRGAFVPLLTLVYLAGALVLLQDRKLARHSAPFAGEGKLSLSIYVGESVVMGLLSLSYGFGLYGKVGPFLALLLCVLVYGLLMVLAGLWRRAFDTGPLEWVLRSISGARQVTITPRGDSR